MNKLNETANSNGVYSLYNGWIKKPIRDDIPDDIDLEPELTEYINKADECKTIEDITKFIDDIYKLRQESILKEGEYGKGNLIFKEIRNKGILQKLKDMKIKLENDEMSIKEAYSHDTLEDLISHYYDPFISVDDLDSIWNEIMAEYDDVDLANDVIDELEAKRDDMWREAVNHETSKPVINEEILPEDLINKYNDSVIKDYRTRAGLSDDEIITEEKLDDWALKSTSCYMNYDYDNLKDLLIGGNK